MICPNYIKKILSGGASGFVGVLAEDESKIAKFCNPLNEEQKEDIAKEGKIYRHLGECRGIPKFYGIKNDAIILERLVNGTIREYIKQNKPPRQQQYKWIKQITDTVEYIHRKGILHCDLTCNNIALNGELDAKVIDFGGSDFKQEKLEWSAITDVSYWLPREATGEAAYTPSLVTDIFALGCCMFEIMHGHKPYHGKTTEEIIKLYYMKQFPLCNTKDNILDCIIINCWEGKYVSATEIKHHLSEVRC